MRTNQAKWDHWKTILTQKDKEYIDSIYPESEHPDVFYEVTPNGTLKQNSVTGVACSHIRKIPYVQSNKKPTKIQVAELIEYVENVSYDPSMILIHWERQESGWKSTSAVKFTELDSSSRFVDYEAAKRVADERRELFESNKAKIEAGTHVKCSYCPKLVPIEEAVDYKIISYASYGPQGRVNKYCSRQCGIHDQMAHEG